MRIIISPYSVKLRSGKRNPKDYPYWRELVRLLNVWNHILQIGIEGEEKIEGTPTFQLLGRTFKELEDLVAGADTWISVDNFFPHFINATSGKPGIVLYSQSDPLIFGYPYNRNLLQSRGCLRQFQFDSWEAAEYNAEAFVSPDTVVEEFDAWIHGAGRVAAVDVARRSAAPA